MFNTVSSCRAIILSVMLVIGFGGVGIAQIQSPIAPPPPTALLTQANTWSAVQTYGAGDFIITGAVSGDIGTFNSSHALIDSGTLLSSLAPLASPTFTGTITAATVTISGNLNGAAATNLTLNAASTTQILLGVAGTPYVAMGTGALYPVTDSTFNLGGSSNKFGAIYTVAMNITGTTTLGTVATGTGSFLCGAASTAITLEAATCIASDARIKHDIRSISAVEALWAFMTRQGVRFIYNPGKGAPGVHIGTIAQTWEKDFPELVTSDPDGTKHFDYMGAFGLVVSSIHGLIIWNILLTLGFGVLLWKRK